MKERSQQGKVPVKNLRWFLYHQISAPRGNNPALCIAETEIEKQLQQQKGYLFHYIHKYKMITK